MCGKHITFGEHSMLAEHPASIADVGYNLNIINDKVSRIVPINHLLSCVVLSYSALLVNTQPQLASQALA